MRALHRFSRIALTLACAGSICGAIALPAQAHRTLQTETLLQTDPRNPPSPPPDGQIEGACGLAVAPGGGLYVSDHYHRAVDLFSTSGIFGSGISVGVPPEGPCGLALGSGGALYANLFHQQVLRIAPSVKVIDSHHPTGISIDPTTDLLYVADHDPGDVSYVSVFEPSGTQLPLQIGLGSLGDAYGVAAFGGRVYVPDAADDTVKVYEPATDPAQPAFVIAGFNSLRNAAATVDPTNAHLLVVDNLQPGFEHPIALVDEYDADGTFLGQLPGALIHGEPSGISVDPASGDLYVTSGNDEDSNVFSYGPYEAAPASAQPPPRGISTRCRACRRLDGRDIGYREPAIVRGPEATPARPQSSRAPSPPPDKAEPMKRAAAVAVAFGLILASLADAEVINHGRFRVAVDASLAPKRLPRSGAAPVHLSLDARFIATKGSTPPQLRRIRLEINRHGHLDPSGMPLCRLNQIQPATTAIALQACRSSLVGEGHLAAKVRFTQQSPFPSNGKLVAFNGRWKGKPAILAHVYGPKPVPTSYTIPFAITSIGKGAFGTELSASLPGFSSKWGYVTAISMDLGHNFTYHGRHGSYLSAGCPAPNDIPIVSFPLSRASFGFADDQNVTSVLHRSCRVRR